MSKDKNPRVFLDLPIGGIYCGRITIELFANIVPKTAANFRALCTGERGLGAGTKKPLHFKGTTIYCVVQGFVAQGGDFSQGNGLGGESIYGGTFPDENFALKHNKRGIISMVNSGPHTNGSLFLITLDKIPQLDCHNVVFGEVVDGMPVLQELERVASNNGRPSQEVIISNCGEVSDVEKHEEESEGIGAGSEYRGSLSSDKNKSEEHRSSRRRHHGSSSDDSYWEGEDRRESNTRKRRPRSSKSNSEKKHRGSRRRRNKSSSEESEMEDRRGKRKSKLSESSSHHHRSNK